MQYTGLMIGGPMDGKMLTHDSDRWDYHKQPESLNAPIDYSDKKAVQSYVNATSERGQYYYTDMAVFGTARRKRIGFWVEHDSSLDDALEAILTRYSEPRRDKNLLKRAGRMVYRLLRSLGSPSETDFREARNVIEEIERTTNENLF